MNKPIFVNEVTRLPVDWANSVSDLVYDVFNNANTLSDARRILGIGDFAAQSARDVHITGGEIDGVTIGDTAPGLGTFISISLADSKPAYPNSVVCRQWVEAAIVAAVGVLRWQDMAQQRSNAVNITGGAGTFDTLRIRGTPVLDSDVVTLGWASDNLLTVMVQAPVPMTIAADNRTVNTGWEPRIGRMAIFVDGLYQLPDQYMVYSETQIQFIEPLPADSVVGGFRV